MKRTVGETIQTYLNKGLPALKKKLRRLEDKNLPIEKSVLFNRVAASVKEFLERKELNSAKISQCTSIEELSDLVFEIFDGIKGIGYDTLNSYIYHEAYIHNLPIDSSCEVFLSEKSRKGIENKGIVFDVLENQLQQKYLKDGQLTKLECVDLVNRNYNLIQEYPYEQ